MSKVIMIPARWNSQRFPGKMMAEIAGRPLIEWTWRAAMMTGQQVIVVTDTEVIFDHIESLGGMAVMTPSILQNGTERCAFWAGGTRWRHIINWQGDAPLIPPCFAVALLDELGAGEPVVTAGAMTPAHEGAVRIELDCKGRAIDFMRCPAGVTGRILMHCGIYGYNSDYLMGYAKTPQSELEIERGLEQLRIPGQMKVIIGDASPEEMRECNHPADIEHLAAILSKRKI
jgi:3-deoxy-manno-octulosonate cytidylyltransferase (CMP-KDO synthetase)